MSVILKSISINTSQLPLQLEFYRALGLDLKAQKVEKGSQVYKADIQPGVEFCLFGVMERKNAGSPPAQIQFSVENLEQVFDKIKSIPSIFVILDPTDLPDGKKAILKDVDGNAIELIQNHT
jgi:lactoylglutathione lyase